MDNLEKYDAIAKRLRETYIQKNEKYGNSFDKSLEKYGLISALTRISDKFNRLETLILNNDNGTTDESLQDTCEDMANYLIMLAKYIESK